MNKRKRGEKGGSYTGGTGDVKPQYMTLAGGITGAVDDYRVDDFNVPIIRPGAAGDDATIMEILSLDWYLRMEDQADAAVFHAGFLCPNTNRSSGDTVTLASMVVDLADPRTFGYAFESRNLQTSGAFAAQLPIHIDLTDNNGNGMLWAGDKITMVASGLNETSASSTICKLKYRFVKVKLIEYLGIVQQQQS